MVRRREEGGAGRRGECREADAGDDERGKWALSGGGECGVPARRRWMWRGGEEVSVARRRGGGECGAAARRR